MTEQSTWSRQRLRDEVSAILDAELTPADDDADLFALGLQSLQLMQLVNQLNRAGAGVGFTQLSQQPRLSAWSALLGAGAADGAAEAHGTRTHGSDVRAAGARRGPAAEGTEPDGSRPFPLTPVQQAYWVGRADDRPLGGVGCHAYLEIDARDVDTDRLQTAFRALLALHPMLRARFEDDGTQRVLPESPWPGLRVHDLRSVPDARARAGALRDQLSHRRLDVTRGEVVDVRVSLLPDGVDRLHFNIDLLVADVHSIRLLLADLAALYDDPASVATPGCTFPRHLAGRVPGRDDARDRARTYWRSRLPELPGGPRLPLAADPGEIGVPRFVRHTRGLPPDLWDTLRRRAADHGITPAVLLATVFAEVLSRWSGDQHFLLNLPLFDRDAGAHPDLGRVVADFTSLVLLEIDMRRAEGFAERARTIQARLHEDVGQAAYTGVDVLRDLLRTDPEAPRTAPVVFACNLDAPLVPDAFAARFGELSWMVSQTPQVWLDHQVYRTRDGGVLLAWDAVEELFPPGLVDTIASSCIALLHRLARDDWHSRAELPLPEDQLRRREQVNSVRRAHSGRLLHEEFFTHAERRSADPALLWGGTESLSHGELAERARRIATALTKRGIGPGHRVAVTVPKGPDQVAAVLGVLAAGAAYVPVGADQPPARRARVVERSGVRLILDGRAGEDDKEVLAGLPVGVETLPVGLALAEEPCTQPVGVSPDDVAYTIFTSGSTGRPKGVDISHRSAVNTVEDIRERYRIGPRDRVLAVSALDFDLSVWDVFGLLGAGGALVLPDEADRRDARRWLELTARHGVTVWNSVPALMDMLITAAGPDRLPSSLRLALLSGDWIPVDLPERLAGATDGRCRLIALGGATEAAIWSNAYDDGSVPPGWRSVPYGRPLGNQRFRVVDRAGRDCPDWVPGELWIGGAGVALGYHADRDQTAERFPVLGGERWYRTGDLGRYRPDGNLEFLGRQDQQVKINGFRVELGEIESVLREHPAIERAVVSLAEGNRDLTAAIVVCPVAPVPVPAPGPATAAETAGPPRDPGTALLGELEELAATTGGPLRVAAWGSDAVAALGPAEGALLDAEITALRPRNGLLVPAASEGGPVSEHAPATEVPCGVPGALLHRFDAVVSVGGPVTRAGVLASVRLLKPGGRLASMLPREQAGHWAESLPSFGFTRVRVAHTGDRALLSARLDPHTPKVEIDALRGWLAERLPGHMLPSRFVAFSHLPLTANGKVDRGWIGRAVASGAGQPATTGEAPRGPLEEMVAAQWKRVLDLTAVSRDESFFLCGGDSLQATRLVAALHARLGVELPMREVLRGPTVAGMSALAERLGACAPADFAEAEEGVL
ncbi:amino acid adenylation domain-containing protein [Streptomyces sp. NPDC012935]|uniref:amino acid adenylation domain-containing protein n=1 Tax=Streptomyces sp. NPDC012935 TaxID=3364857 RepID=UPI0036CBE64D